MDDSLIVTVAGLTMYGRPGLGPFAIIQDGLKGWDEGVDARGEVLARPNASGSFVLPRTLDSRVVSIEGEILAESAIERAAATERLTGILNSGGLGRITVQQPEGTRWAEAMLGGKTVVTKRRGTYRADYQMQLWCPSPDKYGDTAYPPLVTTSSDSFRYLHHWGNSLSYPTIVISGAAPSGYILESEGGAVYRVTRGLVSGVPHTIDMRDGMLRVGSQYVAGGVTSADIFQIVPGGVTASIRIRPISTGSPVATVYVTDTYS